MFQYYDILASYDSMTHTFQVRYNHVVWNTDHSNNDDDGHWKTQWYCSFVLSIIIYFLFCSYGFGHFQGINEGIRWDMLRVPPPKTFLRGYYHSNCLTDLKPGDHIEIQTRSRNDFPHGNY